MTKSYMRGAVTIHANVYLLDILFQWSVIS